MSIHIDEQRVYYDRVTQPDGALPKDLWIWVPDATPFGKRHVWAEEQGSWRKSDPVELEVEQLTDAQLVRNLDGLLGSCFIRIPRNDRWHGVMESGKVRNASNAPQTLVAAGATASWKLGELLPGSVFLPLVTERLATEHVNSLWPNDDFVCSDYQTRVLAFPNGVRFDGDPRIRALMDGLDYGPFVSRQVLVETYWLMLYCAVVEQGIWTINTDGSGWRKLVGATEVAQALGIRPDEVGNFCSDTRGAALDISADGSRLVFLVNAPSGGARSHLFVANGDGSGVRKVFSTDGHVANVGISDDGSTIAWGVVPRDGATKQGWVAAFDGSGQRKLTDAGGMDRSISLSGDGQWVVFGAEAVLYRTDGRGFLVLGPYGNVLSDKRFGWDRMTNLVMSGGTRRFLFVIGDTHLAVLDVDPPDLGPAPQISEVSLTPPDVQPDPRRPMTVKARVTTPYPVITEAAQVHLFLNGRLDETIGGGEDLRDDAKGYGDETYGDSIYTSTNVHGGIASPPGPRRVRIKAEIATPDGRHHATVVEVEAVGAR